MKNLQHKPQTQFNDEYLNLESNFSVGKGNRDRKSVQNTKLAENKPNERYADMDTESNYSRNTDDNNKKKNQSEKRSSKERYSDMDTESNYD